MKKIEKIIRNHDRQMFNHIKLFLKDRTTQHNSKVFNETIRDIEGYIIQQLDEGFIWWLINNHGLNIYTKRVQIRKNHKTHTITEAYEHYLKLKTMFKTEQWYTCDFGTSKVTFLCKAIDGEYLFATENINGKGYSIMLCRTATQEEINGAR